MANSHKKFIEPELEFAERFIRVLVLNKAIQALLNKLDAKSGAAPDIPDLLAELKIQLVRTEELGREVANEQMMQFIFEMYDGFNVYVVCYLGTLMLTSCANRVELILSGSERHALEVDEDVLVQTIEYFIDGQWADKTVMSIALCMA